MNAGTFCVGADWQSTNTNRALDPKKCGRDGILISIGHRWLVWVTEREVVRLVAEGMRNQEISLQLNLREHTVRNYLFRIFDKLGISSRVELVLYAVSRSEQITPPPS